MGWVNAPLPAESQTENRTHFLPEGPNGMRNRCDLKGGWLVVGITLRSTLTPSPQTTSTNSRGNVHSTSATTALPWPSTDHFGMSTSPVVTKNSPAPRALTMGLQSAEVGTRSSLT